MNIEIPIFTFEQASKDVFPLIIYSGTEALKESNRLNKYNASLREVFGLCVLSTFRSILESDQNWIFGTKSQISDDGVVGTIDDKKISYYEKIEQVYLPGCFIEMDSSKSMNDHILEQINRTKNKGSEYEKDQSLFILSDIKSGNSNDTFEWQDFVKNFFTEYNFLHLYFLTLVNHTPEYNEYYLLSFTYQKHRQKLNGEFRFKVKKNEISDFECIQRINLLENK